MSTEATDTKAADRGERNARLAVTVFPLLVIVGAIASFSSPATFAGWAKHVTTLLTIIMFGMGLTLTVPDFALIFRRPIPVFIGVGAQYLIMPLLGWSIAKGLNLEPELAAGVILVGTCPGGTASNVVSYLAKGDVALSVTMTSVSTLLAPIMTPALTLWLAGTYMPVDAKSMAMSIVKIVLIPIVGGLVIRALIPSIVKKIEPILPWISVFAITGVVIAVIPGSADKFAAAAGTVILAVVLHNVGGYLLGYGLAKATKQTDRAARTIAIEVGMQNSGLAAGLAAQYFSPFAALPAAIFSTWHNVSGALFAAIVRNRPLKDEVAK